MFTFLFITQLLTSALLGAAVTSAHMDGEKITRNLIALTLIGHTISIALSPVS